MIVGMAVLEGEAMMARRSFATGILILITGPLAETAFADCSQIQAQITSTFSDVQRAKEAFKKDALDEVKRGPANSPQEAADGLSRAISSTEAVRSETAKAIAVLMKAETERCYGADGKSWAPAISRAQQTYNELAESVATYQQQRSQIRRNYGLRGD